MTVSQIIWFKSYDPGRGLRKYRGTINHLSNDKGLPVCGIQPAYAPKRLQISGDMGDPRVPLDCKKCQALTRVI